MADNVRYVLFLILIWFILPSIVQYTLVLTAPHWMQAFSCQTTGLIILLHPNPLRETTTHLSENHLINAYVTNCHIKDS